MLLKDYLGSDSVERLAEELNISDPQFSEDCVKNISSLSLTERASRFAEIANRFLPEKPEDKCDYLYTVLSELPKADNSLIYYPYSYMVSDYCLPAGAYAEPVLLALTEVFTAEFAVRPFFNSYPTMRQLPLQWAYSSNEHHRRLASEGLRPYLPWAQKLQFIADDPSLLLEVCNVLSKDPSTYVTTSVANALNDVSKDHPSKVIDTVILWKSTAVAEKVILQALRTLIKQPYPRALEVLGVATNLPVSLSDINVTFPESVKIGNSVTFTVDLTVNTKTLVDLVISFPRPTGKAYVKVFKGKILQPGKHCFKRTINFSQQTTRKVFPGSHTVGLQVNGQLYPAGALEVKM